jgi:hypothetical protein
VGQHGAACLSFLVFLYDSFLLLLALDEVLTEKSHSKLEFLHESSIRFLWLLHTYTKLREQTDNETIL